VRRFGCAGELQMRLHRRIVIINALVDSSEYRAESAVFALRSMTAPRARVIRDHAQVIAATDVVPATF
jgi:Ca2+-transporting ATPase